MPIKHMLLTSLRRSLALACFGVLTACGGTVRNGNGANTPAAAANPPLLMVDGTHLATVRDSLRAGEPRFRPALTELETNANRGLTVAPMSVMDKSVIPPSGDKHDYMSQAPYYWSDPNKSNGLPYIRRDGERNPEIDKITDRVNLQRLATSAFSMALMFYFTGREEYARHTSELIRAWFLDPDTRMNPNLNFGQGIPGTVNGRAAGIVETRFLPEIIDAVTLLQNSSAWTTLDGQGLKTWMHAYLQWLKESQLGTEESTRRNNQETWYELQVTALAIYTEQLNLARVTLHRSQDAIAEEFDPDGKQPRELARTRSWDYSIFDLTAFLHLAWLGERVGVDLWGYETEDGRGLRKGVDYLIPFATGEKKWPHKQITPFRASALHPILRLAAVGWRDPKYRSLADEIGGTTAILDLTLP